MHGAELAGTQVAPLSVRSETDGGTKRGPAHFDMSDAENFEDPENCDNDELQFLDCEDPFEMDHLIAPKTESTHLAEG